MKYEGIFLVLWKGMKGIFSIFKLQHVYNGPQNLDRVICFTWEPKRGDPSGEFEEAASAVV
jgi:hypothetical protein